MLICLNWTRLFLILSTVSQFCTSAWNISTERLHLSLWTQFPYDNKISDLNSNIETSKIVRDLIYACYSRHKGKHVIAHFFRKTHWTGRNKILSGISINSRVQQYIHLPFSLQWDDEISQIDRVIAFGAEGNTPSEQWSSFHFISLNCKFPSGASPSYILEYSSLFAAFLLLCPSIRIVPIWSTKRVSDNTRSRHVVSEIPARCRCYVVRGHC